MHRFFVSERRAEELGAASCTKRPTSCILIKPKADYQKDYDAAKASIKPIVF